jgi:hypothetical protein
VANFYQNLVLDAEEVLSRGAAGIALRNAVAFPDFIYS